MKVNDLVKKNTEFKKIESITNDSYKKICDQKANSEIKKILKDYSDAVKEASKYYVR